MENKEINREILKIWDRFQESGNLYPLLFPEFEKKTLLFIGFNPSFSLYKDKINKIISGTPLENKFSKKSFEKKGEFKEQECQDIIDFEKYSKKNYPYFWKYDQIAKKLKFEKWEHIDLFFYRETSQKEFKSNIIKLEIKKDKDNNIEKIEMNEFGREQLRISSKVIRQIEPKIIVVTNALSSDIINNSEFFKVNKEKFEEKGGYGFLDNKEIPIFFSSMVTGQRALDKYSLERLIWQIKKVIQKKQN